MFSFRSKLLCTTGLALFVGSGAALAGSTIATGGMNLAPLPDAQPGGIHLAACNPCAASACNPCNPCAAGEAPELTAAEANAAWDCILPEATAAWSKSGNVLAATFSGWPKYATQPYVSDTHGGRYVQNHANGAARSYSQFEEVGTMPAGAKLGKPSMTVNAAGRVGVGPLFLMEKMPAGFNTASFDWRYTMIMPDGSIFGTTGGTNAAGVQFCVDCHSAVAEDYDSMFFLPEELRAVSN